MVLEWGEYYMVGFWFGYNILVKWIIQVSVSVYISLRPIIKSQGRFWIRNVKSHSEKLYIHTYKKFVVYKSNVENFPTLKNIWLSVIVINIRKTQIVCVNDEFFLIPVTNEIPWR